MRELQRQRAYNEYNEIKTKWAFLAAVFTNAISSIAAGFSKKKPKMVKPEDFISDEVKKMFDKNYNEKAQQENIRWAKFIEEAKAKGLKGPW